MAAQNDYQGGNYIVDSIMGAERCSQASMEDAVERAAETLSRLGLASRTQAESLVRELQREEDQWLQRRSIRVGLPTLFSMAAMMMGILALLIAFRDLSNDSIVFCSNIAIAVLLVVVLVYWFLEFKKFDRAESSGNISAIRELHRSLNAWLLLNCGTEQEAREERISNPDTLRKGAIAQESIQSGQTATSTPDNPVCSTNPDAAHLDTKDVDESKDETTCHKASNHGADPLPAIVRGREDEQAGRVRTLDDARDDALAIREAHQHGNRTSG